MWGCSGKKWMPEMDSVLARMRLVCEVPLPRFDLDHIRGQLVLHRCHDEGSHRVGEHVARTKQRPPAFPG